MKETAAITLELLLLNDLLRANVITKEIYEKAAQKIRGRMVSQPAEAITKITA